jgi:hypothetical protein
MRSTWHEDEVVDFIHEQARETVYLAGEYVLETANRTAPIEEETLIRSGEVDMHESEARGSVSYDTPYARRQHEELDYDHDPGRRAKWLELTLVEEGPQVSAFMQAEMERRLA